MGVVRGWENRCYLWSCNGRTGCFKIKIEGKGGHAGIPHETVDSIAIGTQVVSQLQQIVSRLTNPLDSLVISVTQFHAGTTHNVIPEQAEIEGTVRSLRHELRGETEKKIERIVKHITESYGAKYTFSYEYGYRPVVNDYEATELIEQTALQLYGRDRVVRLQPTMAGEDFSAFLQKAPGTFFLSEREIKRKVLYILTITLVLRLTKMHYRLGGSLCISHYELYK